MFYFFVATVMTVKLNNDEYLFYFLCAASSSSATVSLSLSLVMPLSTQLPSSVLSILLCFQTVSVSKPFVLDETNALGSLQSVINQSVQRFLDLK